MKLFEHQKYGIEWLKERPKSILADEMGLGKTIQAVITSAEMSMGATLIICPASIKTTWEREILKEYPEEEIVIVNPGPEKNLKVASWYIINYDMVKKYRQQLKSMIAVGEIETVILDEAHYIKGKTAQRSKVIIDLVNDAKRIHCLTGTPLLNRPIEMFNLLKVIKHPLSSNRTIFSKRYCNGHLKVINRKDGRTIRFWDESGATCLRELKERTQDIMLRRSKKDVLDLPEKIVSVTHVDLNREWQKIYDNAWDEYLEWLWNRPEKYEDIENIIDARQLVEIGKLKQVCSLAKVDRIVSDVENATEQDNKIIIFSQYTKTIEELKRKLGRQAVTLTGQHSTEERAEAVDRFQNNDEIKVFIANIKAGGVGITLTASSIVMFADMDWSPEIHKQAEDRAHRIGQEGTVNVYYYVVRGTIEEDIAETLEAKRMVINEVMDEGDLSDISAASEFLARLKKTVDKSKLDIKG